MEGVTESSYNRVRTLSWRLQSFFWRIIILKNKKLLIFCPTWRYNLPEIEGWDIYCNIQESSPVPPPGGKFGPRYLKAIHDVKPDFVIAVHSGCSESLFEAMDKPRQYGTKYITWSTDSYRHTSRVTTSDLHLSSIPDNTHRDSDNFLPLFSQYDGEVLPLEDRKHKYGLHCREYGNSNRFRQREIQKIKKTLKKDFFINQLELHPYDYMEEIKSYEYGINVGVYEDGLPNFRSFELGCCGVMPISSDKNKKVLDFLFENRIIVYGDIEEIPSLIKPYDPVEVSRFYNEKHCLKARLVEMFDKYFGIKF